MGAEVEFKLFFPAYFTDGVNEENGNKSSRLSQNKSTTENGNRLNGFSRWSAADMYFGREKEELRQMILKQDSVFKQQLHELHRLYKRQRDLMNEFQSKDLSKSLASASSCRPSLFSYNHESKQHLHSFPQGFPRSGRILTLDEAQNSACLRAIFHERGQLNNNLKNEQLTSIGNSFSGRSLPGPPFDSTQVELGKILKPMPHSSDHHSSERYTSRKLFGVEISERNHSGPQLSLHELPAGSDTSFTKSTQSTQIVESGQLPFRNPRERDVSYQMSTVSIRMNFHRFVGDMNKMRATAPLSSGQDSSSLTVTIDSDKKRRVEANGCSGNGKILGPHIHESHPAGGSFNSNLDNSISLNSAASGIRQRSEVEQLMEKTNINGCSSREFLDLNVCPTPSEEEDAPPTFCSDTFQPIRGEIDLEVPAVEADESLREESTDSKQGSSVTLDDGSREKSVVVRLRFAAETLVAMSSVSSDKIQEQIILDKTEDRGSETLQWFAETIISSLETENLNQGEYAPDGMDYFEFATLNLAETKVDEPSYKPCVAEELQKNSPSGRRGRKKKDFQRDVLPGLTSLSRYEVTEDLQTIGGLIKADRRASRAETLQRSGVSKGSKGRGRANKRNSMDNDSTNARDIQKPKFHELGIDGRVLMGWGKRARRPRRSRCSSAIHSVSRKEVF